ncbi:glucosaminidase domain-containing protein [Halioxenophilus sp. WMMB6]|uniref:glucosaminidase domain-containing protein n=1 Tax=Halioxenophilus sp. WMMB6 TaxID=3073815 RepID=UPI00295E27D0|nr:glucosaminidase domain-containing protein [Halioxenophilus sp. WMMB6]
MPIAQRPTSAQTFLVALFFAYALGLLGLTFWLARPAEEITPTSEPVEPAPAPVEPWHLTQIPPDFGSITEIDAKKGAFYDYLLPGIEYHNQRLAQARKQLLAIAEKLNSDTPLTAPEKERLAALSTQFDSSDIAVLLRRVDQIPPSLAIAQAATESGWGSSRFAQEGNNFYGEWCYKPGCGLVPSRRLKGASHEVRRFDTVADSIGSYFDNINTHPAYRTLRALREQARRDGKPLTGEYLARGLERYSEKGEEYVNYIRAMIRSNDLGRFDAPVASGSG